MAKTKFWGDSNNSLIQRAFALAVSGNCKSVSQIRRILQSEGFTFAETDQLAGSTLSKQLAVKIAASEAGRVS